MSEDRLDKLEARLDARFDELRREMHGLNDGLRQEMHGLGDGLRKEMHVLHDEAGRQMHALHEDLGRQMRVLHEDTIDRISAMDSRAELRLEFRRGDGVLQEQIDHNELHNQDAHKFFKARLDKLDK